MANFRAHYEGTGPEIWEQTGGNLDAFVAAAGTGGTLAGVSRFLQVSYEERWALLGSSSAMNCVGAVRAVQALGPGHTIVTILCESGMRHLSKIFSDEYPSQYGLTPSAGGLEFLSVG